MTRAELRAFIFKYFCGCGRPEDALGALSRLLKLHQNGETWKETRAILPDDGLRYLLLYQLNHMGLTKHGGGVDGAWLSEFGEEVLSALEREAVDGFEHLVGNFCIHGTAIEEPCEECS